MSKRTIITFSIVVFITSISLLNSIERTEFTLISFLYTSSFFSYLFLIKYQRNIKYQHLIFLSGIVYIISMIYEPLLSDDYYRFIWDGEITWAGFNPFDFKPEELLQQKCINKNAYLLNLYDFMSPLSQANYSIYPPINQIYFIIATALSDSIKINTFILKLLIVTTEIIGAIYLRKLLINLKIKTSRMWLLYLNPLWIIESVGNCHFEGVMISYLFIAIYFLSKYKMILGSMFFAIAIQIKLIPFIFLPFFYRFLGLWRSTLFYSITIIIVMLLALIHLNLYNIENFFNSIKLYFEVFEFNSFILYNYIQYGIAETGWNLTKIYGPQLSKISIGIIVILSLYGQIDNWKKLFNRITIALFLYLLFSSTIHPWYILTMFAMSIFTNYSFPIFWTFIIFFSYIFYHFNDSSVIEFRLFVNLEYFLIISLFLYEIINKKSPIKFLRLN